MIEFKITFKEDRGLVEVSLESPNTQATELEAKRASEFKELFMTWMQKNKAVQTNSN